MDWRVAVLKDGFSGSLPYWPLCHQCIPLPFWLSSWPLLWLVWGSKPHVWTIKTTCSCPHFAFIWQQPITKVTVASGGPRDWMWDSLSTLDWHSLAHFLWHVQVARVYLWAIWSAMGIWHDSGWACLDLNMGYWEWHFGGNIYSVC